MKLHWVPATIIILFLIYHFFGDKIMTKGEVSTFITPDSVRMEPLKSSMVSVDNTPIKEQRRKKVRIIPAGVNSETNKYKYIEYWSPLAVKHMKQYGIPASVSLAQGLLESAAGTSELVRNTNNHFCIKCSPRNTNCKKGHCWNKEDDSIKDFFLIYKSGEESWEHHAKFITSGNYTILRRLAPDDYKGWAYGLKKCRYATKDTYAEDLINVIETYGLHKYDRSSKMSLIAVEKPVLKLSKPTQEIKKTKKVETTKPSYGKGPISGPMLSGN